MANNRLNATITIGGAISAGLRSAIGSAVGGLRQIGGAVDALTNRQRELNRIVRDQERLGGAGSALRIRYAQQEIAQVERQIAAYRRLQTQLQANQTAAQANQQRRTDVRGKIGETVALGAAVVLPAAAAVKRSAEFNYQLQAIGNTADMSRADIAALGVDILKISDDTGKSAQTVQGAMGFLVAAGMDVGVANTHLRAIGRTSTATASEIQDVAKAAFTMNDALKIATGPDKVKNAQEMQRALDILVQSGKEGNFEFKDMAAELPVLGAAFQSLKMTGVEATATLGAALQIARKGAGSSSQAATNTENFLAKLMSPETLKKAEKLGSDLYGVISKAQKKGDNPFEAAIAEINRVTKGGDQKLLGELFADMQVQNFLRPMLQNLDEYKRIKKAALGADGVTDRDFIRMSETTKQQLDNMTNAAGRAAIAVGDALEPAVGKLAATMTPVIRNVTEFVSANKELVGNSILVVGGLATMRLATLAAGYAWTFVRGTVIAAQGAFLGAQAGLLLFRSGAIGAAAASSGMATAVLLLGSGLRVLGKGILFALNPMNLLRGSVALAGGAFVALTTGARVATASVLAFGRASAGAALAGIRSLGAGLLAFAASPVAMTVAGARAVGTALYGMARGGLAAAIGGVRALGLAIVSNPVGVAVAAIVTGGALIYKYWEPLKAFFVGFGQGLAAGLAPVGQAISDAFAPVGNIIGPVVMPVLEKVGGWIRSAVGWFGELLTPIGAASETTTKFAEAGKVCGEVVAQAFTVMMTPIRLVLESIKWINDNIGGVIEKAAKVGSVISGGWKATKDFVVGPAAPTLPPGGAVAVPPAAPVSPVLKPATQTPAAVVSPVAPVGPNPSPTLKPVVQDAQPVAKQPTTAPTPKQPVPTLPPVRGTGASAAPAPIQQTITNHITQLPGENAEQLARRTAELMRQQQGVQRRGALTDSTQ